MRRESETRIDGMTISTAPRLEGRRAVIRKTPSPHPSRDRINLVPMPCRKLRVEPELSMTGEPFPLGAVLQLIDNCIVPALVDYFLQTRTDLPGLCHSAHNVDQL
jgi:hypothetical protein